MPQSSRRDRVGQDRRATYLVGVPPGTGGNEGDEGGDGGGTM